MKWTLRQLEQMRDTGLSFNELVDVSDLKMRDPEIRDISKVEVSGNAVFEERKITFFLEIKGEMVLPSSLTLEDVHYPVHFHTQEVFAEHPSEKEEEVHEIHNETIDLLPFVKDAILVEIPIKVVGNGERPLSSGNGWEVVSEKQMKDKIDPRLEKLQELLDDNND